VKWFCEHDNDLLVATTPGNFLTDIATSSFSRKSQVNGMWYVLILPCMYLLVTAESYCF